jgi:hypothetical protein
MRDYREYKNAVTQLDTAFYPGFFTGLIKGGKSREESLKTLDQPVQELVRIGQEPMVRQKLATEGLSPTEIEERIHPLPKDFKAKLSTLPNAPFYPTEIASPQEVMEEKPRLKSFDQVQKENPKIIDSLNNKLGKWLYTTLKDNPNLSLSVLRSKVVDDKHYDWRQFSPALLVAREMGFKPNAAQQAELTEVNTQPPRNSLSDIFKDWGRWYDYIRGNK